LNIIFVKVKALPEKRKELSQTLQSIVDQVRKEDGCLNSGFYKDFENENDFLMVEQWASQKDSDDHLRSNIFTVLMGAGCLMRQPPEVVIHTVGRSTDLEV
jgi:quinol monooxygenase YgiN